LFKRKLKLQTAHQRKAGWDNMDNADITRGRRERLLSIEEVSLRLEVPKPTLRFWEREFVGLLLPGRTQGGQRRYGEEDLALIGEIKRLRDRGLPLAEIRDHLADRAREERPGQGEVDLLARRVAEIVRAEITGFFSREKGLK
jgi:DNA-binding transcriptional MerR regulator